MLTLLVGCTQLYGALEPKKESLRSDEVNQAFKVIKMSREASVMLVSYGLSGEEYYGSGAYVVHNGHYFILTAAHVVSDLDKTYVLSKNNFTRLKVVYIDREGDIALLSVGNLNGRVPIPYETAVPEVGTEIYYTGNPHLIQDLTFSGMVSGKRKNKIIINSYAWKGSSGSVVLDPDGKIVGVVSSILLGLDYENRPQLSEDVAIVASIQTVNIDSLSSQ